MNPTKLDTRIERLLVSEFFEVQWFIFEGKRKFELKQFEEN